jgi:hypothetical protein
MRGGTSQRVWPPSPTYVIVFPSPKALSFATLAQMMDARRRTGGSPDDGGLVPGGRAPIHRVRPSKPGV